jgi:acetyl esterase/lipase
MLFLFQARYPEPTEDCVRAYQHLRNGLKIPSNKIIVSGDSVGGSLLFETMMDCHAPDIYDQLGGSNAVGAMEAKRRYDLPAAMMLSSPLVTEKFETPSWKANEKHDIVCAKFARQVLREYFDPKVDPTPETMKVLALARMQSGFEAFTPQHVLVFVGKKEVMRDDILELTDRVKKNSTIDLHVVQEDFVHDWYMIRDLVKKKSILEKNDRVFIRFIKNALEQALGHSVRNSAQFKEVRTRQATRVSVADSIGSNSTAHSSSAQTALESSEAAEAELVETLAQVDSHAEPKSSLEAPVASPTIIGMITV